MADLVTIGALGRGGDGIAELDQSRVYVPFTLPGETVEINRTGGRANLARIISASRERIDPVCQHFGACGGCALQHMEPAAQLEWKRRIVLESFAQRGIDTEVEAVVPIAGHSRRRAIFAAVKTIGGIVLGFHKKGLHEIIDLKECAVLTPTIVNKLVTLREIGKHILRPGKPARIAVIAADNGLDIAIDGAKRLGRSELEFLGSLAADASLARLTVDASQIFLNRQPEIRAGSSTLLPCPGGFIQASAAAEAVLASALLDHIGDASPVADLFAGIGTFAIRLARSTAVTAVEGDDDLLGAIEASCRATPGLKPVTVRKRDLFRNPLAATELNKFSAVVFDPPAAGAKAQAEAVAQSKVAKVVAVSCNPATLARDARILIEGGFNLRSVLPVDQFQFTSEIEVVATFER